MLYMLEPLFLLPYIWLGLLNGLNGYLKFWQMSINDIRLTGTLANKVALTVLALISTSVASLKHNYFILETAIVISLISIFLGTSEYTGRNGTYYFLMKASVPLEVVFAVFFLSCYRFYCGYML